MNLGAQLPRQLASIRSAAGARVSTPNAVHGGGHISQLAGAPALCSGVEARRSCSGLPPGGRPGYSERGVGVHRNPIDTAPHVPPHSVHTRVRIGPVAYVLPLHVPALADSGLPHGPCGRLGEQPVWAAAGVLKAFALEGSKMRPSQGPHLSLRREVVESLSTKRETMPYS